MSKVIDKCQTAVLVGLVSNGKSTLANALIGKAIMPTSNLVCTSMSVTVIDPLVDGTMPKAVLLNNDSAIVIDAEDIVSVIEDHNLVGGGNFCLKMPLNKLNHAQFPVAIIDTPGVNDGMDAQYSHLSNNILRNTNNPTVIYVSHVRSCGTSDEERCLRELANTMSEKKINEWFFVLNGWNFLDMSHCQEDKVNYLHKIYAMAQKCDMPKPQIFFVAALPAELCVKCMDGIVLTRSEEIKLDEFLSNIDLRKRAKSNKKTLGKVSNKTLRTALYYSGITSLERALYTHFQKNRKGCCNDENI